MFISYDFVSSKGFYSDIFIDWYMLKAVYLKKNEDLTFKMSEVDMAEELPNGDDSAFEDQQQGSEDHSESLTAHSISNSISINENETVYVTSTNEQELLQSGEYEAIKGAHIVIHEQLDSGLKSPTTPLPPPTPATPLSKERGLKYQWDESVDHDVLPVRCKNTNGELFKSKFGSGQ